MKSDNKWDSNDSWVCTPQGQVVDVRVNELIDLALEFAYEQRRGAAGPFVTCRVRFGEHGPVATVDEYVRTIANSEYYRLGLYTSNGELVKEQEYHVCTPDSRTSDLSDPIRFVFASADAP